MRAAWQSGRRSNRMGLDPADIGAQRPRLLHSTRNPAARFLLVQAALDILEAAAQAFEGL